MGGKDLCGKDVFRLKWKSVGVINAESGDSEDDVTSSITHSKTAHLSWNAREH